MISFHNLIVHYGYFGLFFLLILGIVGLPLPDETMLIFSGYLISKGDMSAVFTFISAYFGSIIGISLSYLIGGTFGFSLLSKYGHFIRVTDEKLETVHKWFEKFGKWLLLIGYFIPGVRHIVAILAGVSKLKIWEFMAFAYSGAFIWVTMFLSIGYIFGSKWRSIQEIVKHNLTLISAFVIVLLIIAYYIKNKHIKSKKISG